MEVYVILLCISCYIANVSSQHSEPHVVRSRSLPVVDALISRLAREHWAADDGACLRATLDMLRGVNNNTLWATWVWDSMQLPAASMYGVDAYIGNYDQCLRAPWSADQSHPGIRSQYCLMDVRGPATKQVNTFGPFDDTEDYYRTPTKDGRRFNLHSFGACLPSICSPSSVARISQHLLRLTHLPDGDVTVDPRNCETAGEVTEYPARFYLFWSVAGILLATAITSTNFNNEKPTTLGMITRSFCMKRNYRSLFTVSRDEVKVIHGMRFLTSVLIVLSHEIYFGIISPCVNALDVDKLLTSPVGLIMLLHADILVDTFFTMSGLLLVRGLMMGKQNNLIYTLIKRYFRLIGPFAMCTLYYTLAWGCMASGPLWRKSTSWDTEVCAKYWWKNLLMANTDITTVCYIMTWYIAIDFQLAILGTFLFYLFRRNRRLGVTAFLAVAVGLSVNLALTVYWNQLDMVPFNVGIFRSARDFPHLNDTYFSAHAHAGPYLVGMVMGYIISTYRPAEHRNMIGKQWSVYIAAIAIVVGFTAIGIGAIFAGRPYDPLEAAVVVATNRIIWGAFVCSIIAVCEYGSQTLIPRFLGWPGFVPLSKLSYCIYLLHSILIQLHKFSARSAATYSFYNAMVNASGVLVLTCGFSLALHLVVEAPLSNVANAMFTEKPKPLEQHGTTAETKHNGTGVTQGLQINGNKDKLF